MLQDTILALDIGTTCIKAILVARNSDIVSVGTAGYETLSSAGGVVEQRPGDWWCSCIDAIGQALHSVKGTCKITAIALTGQMQDLILLNEAGEVLRNAILYSDTRASEQVRQIEQILDGQALLVQTTANVQGAASLLAKWMWVRDNEPIIYHQSTTMLIGAHDYVCMRMCGARVTDVTTASTTGLLNIHSNEWATEDLLRPLALRSDVLPCLVAPDIIVGHVTLSFAGVPIGTPVFHGCGDVAATTVGVGAGRPGEAYMYVGTSGWIAKSVSHLPAAHSTDVLSVRHADPSFFIQAASMATAGGNLEWLRAVLGAHDIGWDVLDQEASSVSPGSNGLLYLPYLNGERCPFVDPSARGCFIGLSSATTRAHMCRAVMEGVAYALRHLLSCLNKDDDSLKQNVATMHMVGGGARSYIWPQIMADVLGCHVEAQVHSEGVASAGAALLAFKGLGWVLQCTRLAPQTEVSVRTFAPLKDAHDIYNSMFDIYNSMYPILKNSFKKLSKIR